MISLPNLILQYTHLSGDFFICGSLLIYSSLCCYSLWTDRKYDTQKVEEEGAFYLLTSYQGVHDSEQWVAMPHVSAIIIGYSTFQVPSSGAHHSYTNPITYLISKFAISQSRWSYHSTSQLLYESPSVSYKQTDLYQLTYFKPPKKFFNSWAKWLKYCGDVYEQV